MSAFAPIVLDNGEATPVAITFAPSAIDSAGVAKLFETGTSLGFDRRKALSLSVRLPKVGGSVARVTAKVVVPVINAATGLKEAECIATAEFVLPKIAEGLDRSNLLAFLSNFLQDASVEAAVNNLESIY